MIQQIGTKLIGGQEEDQKLIPHLQMLKKTALQQSDTTPQLDRSMH
jgi:hypothetical protein